ncbi:MAG: deoxynucleoside kinase [Gammaproteobacteria bacterium]|nr:deoxynucleoside kinase [Gammaproteobacteria bacterium]
MIAASPRYIVVEGPIGVGKTSLARRLADSFECDLLEEQPWANPFLERFYQDPRNGALPVQLFFLFQRARQLEEERQRDLFSPVKVADYLMEKDRLFAELILDPQEWDLYQQIYDRLDIQAPTPDLVIYLQAPVKTLLDRVARRGVKFEQMIKRDYLERLMEAYARFFHQYDDSPLLIVNTADIDPVGSDTDYQQLLQQVNAIRSGRHFYNPVSRSIA